MILTVTLNPALDLAGGVERVVPGPKLRLGGLRRDPGGGGVNVARVVARLGGEGRALVALGGAVGAQLAALIRAEGVVLVPFDAPGETRQSLTVHCAQTGGEYRFVLPGEDWPEALAKAALDTAVSEAGAGLVVLSGSQPPGVPDDFAHRLAAGLGRAALIVDTSGAALRAVASGPNPGLLALRMDEAEAQALSGRALATLGETLRFAASLQARGVARLVVIARGAQGSVMVGPGGAFACAPPRVQVVSKVGAGDSFTAAFALALDRGSPADEALRMGTAAAAAAVTTGGTDLCHAADVARLAPLCRLERL